MSNKEKKDKKVQDAVAPEKAKASLELVVNKDAVNPTVPAADEVTLKEPDPGVVLPGRKLGVLKTPAIIVDGEILKSTQTGLSVGEAHVYVRQFQGGAQAELSEVVAKSKRGYMLGQHTKKIKLDRYENSTGSVVIYADAESTVVASTNKYAPQRDHSLPALVIVAINSTLINISTSHLSTVERVSLVSFGISAEDVVVSKGESTMASSRYLGDINVEKDNNPPWALAKEWTDVKHVTLAHSAILEPIQIDAKGGVIANSIVRKSRLSGPLDIRDSTLYDSELSSSDWIGLNKVSISKFMASAKGAIRGYNSVITGKHGRFDAESINLFHSLSIDNFPTPDRNRTVTLVSTQEGYRVSLSHFYNDDNSILIKYDENQQGRPWSGRNLGFDSEPGNDQDMSVRGRVSRLLRKNWGVPNNSIATSIREYTLDTITARVKLLNVIRAAQEITQENGEVPFDIYPD